MSREIVRDQGVMMLLGSVRAEQRVATFLINLMRRLRARGFSSSSVVLRMTRDEIGSYLGLTLETVSRTFSRMQDDGLLEVRAREVRVAQARQLPQLVRRTAYGASATSATSPNVSHVSHVIDVIEHGDLSATVRPSPHGCVPSARASWQGR